MDVNIDSRGVRYNRLGAEQMGKPPVPIQLISEQIMTIDLANLEPLTKEIKIGRSLFIWRFYGEWPNCTVVLHKVATLDEPVTKWMNNERVIVQKQGPQKLEILSQPPYRFRSTTAPDCKSTVDR